jgi:predicted site-specific integrase-resolvase
MTSTELLLNTEEVAEMLGIASHTLAVWRSEGRTDLPYIKIGRSVRYEMRDILAYLDAQRVTHNTLK